MTPSKQVVLCLSGGGYRAAAYHLGAMRRLHELDLLAQVDEIHAVSGGAFLAACLAAALKRKGGDLASIDWEVDVAVPIRKLLRQDRRTLQVLLTLPINWLWKRPRTALLERSLDKALGGLRLDELPLKPRVHFLATDLIRGDRVTLPGGIGGGWPVARAVVASAALPPLFGPMVVTGDGANLRQYALADGGVWGNLGVSSETLGTAGVVLVSDASYPLPTAPTRRRPRIWLTRSLRVAVRRGDAALRYQMWLTDSQHQRFEIWRIAETTWRPEDSPPAFEYSLSATASISAVRTDFDAFRPTEIAIVENHGYLRAASCLSWFMHRVRSPDGDPSAVDKANAALLLELPSTSGLPLVRPPHPNLLDDDACVLELCGSNARVFKLRTLRRLITKSRIRHAL